MVEFKSNIPEYKIFSWVLANTCNFTCSYCPDHLHANTYRFPTLTQAIKVFDTFRGNKNNKVYYELVGGEPTLWPKLQDYIKHINDDNTFIELGSNGSRTARYWDNFKIPVDFLYLSFHPEQADENKFIETIESVHTRMRTHVTILLVPKLWDKCKRFFEKIFYERVDLKINVTFTLVRPNFSEEPEPYNDEMKKYFDMPKKNRAILNTKDFPHIIKYNDLNLHWRKFQYHKFNNFKGMHCYIPTDRLYIRYNGDIYYGTCQEGGLLGNIYKDNYDLSRKEPVICSKTSCGCKLDALVKKTGTYIYENKQEEILKTLL